MRTNRKLFGGLAVMSFVACALASGPVQAAEVLVNGGFELSAGPANWSLTQFASGPAGAAGDFNNDGKVDAADYVKWRKDGDNPLPNDNGLGTSADRFNLWRSSFGNMGGGGGMFPISAVEHVDLANEPMNIEGELGLLVKPFAGNVGAYMDQNRKVTVNLSQTTASAVPGRTYTLTGHSYYQLAASNNLDTLFSDSPSGAVASPTTSYFEIAFLNASNAVIGSPTRLDLPKNRPTDVLPDDWRTHMLAAVAPAGSAKVRVSVGLNDMVASCTSSCPAGQDVYLDNFTLRDSGVPGLERLLNPGLNILGAPSGWTIEKTPQDNLQFSTEDYAIHTGFTGMWMRSFAGGDAKVLQTVAGSAGTSYTFSGWSKWETGYNGADPASATETFLRMEFLDGSNAVIGSPLTLDLKRGSDGDIFTPDPDQQQPDGTWRQFAIDPTVAPLGTMSVRVSAGATMMGNSGINPQSAMFDDFSLMTGSGSGSAIPEPGSMALVGMALVGAAGIRRRFN